MKRDMDLVRDILFAVESSDEPLDANDLVNRENSADKVVHHLLLMNAHGLLNVTGELLILNDEQEVRGHVDSLTWNGCDYLDAIRDHKIWQATKDAIAKAVGSTTMDIFKETAKLLAMQAIKAGLGM